MEGPLQLGQYSPFRSRNNIQERPTQIYAYYVLYTVGGIYKPSAPTEVEGKG